MIDRTHFRDLKKQLEKKAVRHRDVIKLSGDAQQLAKQAIFALHRKDQKDAQVKIKDAGKKLASLQKKYPELELIMEGSYRSGLEEYVEAVLLLEYVKGNTFSEIKGFTIPSDIYLAGLGDVPGELYRFAVRDATEGHVDLIKQHVNAATDIVTVLVSMDLTKYLRTKTDQAKQALQKLEYLYYQQSLR